MTRFFCYLRQTARGQLKSLADKSTSFLFTSNTQRQSALTFHLFRFPFGGSHNHHFGSSTTDVCSLFVFFLPLAVRFCELRGTHGVFNVRNHLSACCAQEGSIPTSLHKYSLGRTEKKIITLPRPGVELLPPCYSPARQSNTPRPHAIC